MVGIGASAGGLQAVKAFFEHMPKDCGMAFVVVLHLSPDHQSVADKDHPGNDPHAGVAGQ